MRLKFYLIFSIFFFISTYFSYAQSYGLGFYGHEVVQDKRTGLDLSPDNSICLTKKFELRFDLSFIPGYADYFGYIFRSIDKEKRNIDLIYDKRFAENRHFVLVIGDKKSNISFDIPIEKLYKNWHTISLIFDVDKDLITLICEGKSYTQHVRLEKNCYKFLFGANDFEEFKTTDVPPMVIKDIKIFDNDKISYQWDLNEKTGFKAVEKINSQDAAAVNPIWIKKQHHDWELVEKLNVKGAASIAFDKDSETLYIVGEDSLVNYRLASRQLNFIPYAHGNYPLLRGNQSLFAGQNGLTNFYIDQKLAATFNPTDRTWSKRYKVPDNITNYWHPNKFYFPQDSSLYVFGGYGQFKYHNEVLSYSFQNKVWQTLKVKNNIMPRYLSALGVTAKGAYILGGYGSSTGEQILNPKNTYDLNFFDPINKKFRKLFELKTQNHEFAFANSMIINEEDHSYYALAFPNHKYNSALQLIKGSLDSALYKPVGNEIPYVFHDINSFADLFYAPESKKFIAVTLFYTEETNETSLEIYTLYGPPEPTAMDFSPSSTSIMSWIVIALIILFLVIGLMVYLRRFLYRSKENAAIIISKTQSQSLGNDRPGLDKKVAKSVTEPEKTENAVFLFGDMQLFEREGKDITKYFTPLIKELFLVVLLHTIRWGRGISTEKLTEILWFDKSIESARNNRSVNIAKLKTILEKVDGLQISKDTGYWKIKMDESKVQIDYSSYLQIVNSKEGINKEKVNELTEIVQRGGFLSTVEYDWLDAFKSEISNEVIDTYLHFASNLKIEDDAEFLVSLASLVFYFDPVNEEAMAIKCKALVFLGKHSLAKTSFETFCKDYKAIYGEDFDKMFQEILS